MSRRMHHNIRAAFSVSDLQDLMQKLSPTETGAPRTHKPVRTTTAFIFPGQGLRFEGYGKVLYKACPPFRRIIEDLEAVSKSLGLSSFFRLLLEDNIDAISAGPVVSQLAIDLTNFWIKYKGGVAALEKKLKQQESQRHNVNSTTETKNFHLMSPKVSSSSHWIDQENLSGQQATIVFCTDVQQPPIRNLIEGHSPVSVFGIDLTPSSVYADTALMAAQHLYSQLHPPQRQFQLWTLCKCPFQPLWS